MELTDSALATVLALFNFLPQAQEDTRDALISCACEVHASTLALAKSALDTKSPLAPRLWKNVGEQLQCASSQPALEQMLHSVPETVLYLLQYAASQLKSAVQTWSQAEVGPQTDTQLRDRRLAAPIRHGLLTVLRITASCPASVASQQCILELSFFNIIVQSSASSSASKLPTSARSLLTKSVGEAMHAVLAMLLESELVSDASKCFLVQALCERELTEATATFRSWEGDGELTNMLPIGRLASFSSLLSHSSKYSLAVKEALANQLSCLHNLVEQSYPSLLVHSGPQNQYELLLRSLASFAVVAEASGSSKVRQAVECFLFENALRRHPLLQELVLDLWGFLFESSEPSLQEAQLSSLFTILSGLVVAETAQLGNTAPAVSREQQHLASATSNVARLINQLLSAASLKQVDSAYMQCIGPVNKSLTDARVCEVLLQNGFPIERLSVSRQKDLRGPLVESLIRAAKEEVERAGKRAVSTAGNLRLQVHLRIVQAILIDP